LIALLGVVVAIATSVTSTASESLVYIGTRSAPPPAAAASATGTAGAPTPAPAATGIYAARFDSRSGKLTALGLQQSLRGATWLIANPRHSILYSVGKPANPTVMASNIYSFSVDRASGALHPIEQVPTGGHDTTHLYLDAATATLFGASYGGGEVTAAPVLADGHVSAMASMQKNFGTGPHPRQTAPHAHGVALDPSRHFLLSTDLGADRIFVYRFDAASRTLTPADPAFEAVTPGSGPRHLLFHPNGQYLYVNTELSAELRVYRWDAAAGRLQLVQTRSTYPDGYTGNSRSSSEIALSHDGRFLYVTLRGDQNSVVVYGVNGKTGELNELQRLPSQGKQPWAFALDPSGRWLVVANNASGTVDVLAVNRRTGLLTATGESLAVPDAGAVAFFGE
jgi:6-phosphogluconolactonase